MKNNGYKPRVPDIMEAVFDIGYLLFDLIAAVLFFVFSRGEQLICVVRHSHLDLMRRRCIPLGPPCDSCIPWQQ